ncbi:DASH complex subunit Hsk3 like-domain-containing protein [Protomyces lactucae-debilis]|uniref:DASH complex subunit Hsk3 like-domain-containing protein n=1 Tax=Protomyces lactucae-debilis TaxID=2754530 RepID=A0A1Y2FQV8_PROLT|nr:DASH complex subunit Hsk3 like-domain-containing protein [Protomyces lactucae-debilis]ORY86319.1 DASH complex subunit Hsk3 like-domain-containing protein [Protomyces lactucae-debilis]
MSTRQSSSAHQSRSSLAPGQHKQRQLAHLNAQLAQLQAHLADLDDHLRVTAVQSGAIRKLGALQGGLFMAASQVLVENEFEQKER